MGGTRSTLGDVLAYRELALQVLAATADKCINHAWLASIAEDEKRKVFHEFHANKHAEQAIREAREWWHHGKEAGLI